MNTQQDNFFFMSLCILLILTCTVAIVFGSEKSNQPMEGVFIGVQGESAWLKLHGDYELVQPLQTRDQTAINWQATKPGVGFFGGWGHYVDDLFYGVESMVSFYPGKIDDYIQTRGKQGTEQIFTIENSYKVQFSGMLGKSITRDLLLYSRLGVVYTDINVAAYSLVSEQGGKLDWAGGAVHDWLGGVVGLGLAYNIAAHLALKVEYSFTNYFIGPKYENDKHDGEKTDYTFHDHRIGLGLIYTF